MDSIGEYDLSSKYVECGVYLDAILHILLREISLWNGLIVGAMWLIIIIVSLANSLRHPLSGCVWFLCRAKFRKFV